MCIKFGKLRIAIFILFLGFQFVVFGQETIPDQKKETDELSTEQKALRKDMETIKRLMLKSQKSARPKINVRDVEFELGNNPVKGSNSARLVIVEFSDYSCHYCARHAKETYPEIYKNYINTGKLRYVIIDNPLPSHDMAKKAAEAAHCANEQEKFWEMHDEMMLDQESLNELTTIASFIDLDIQKFKSCLDTKKYTNKVNANISLASKLKIPSVPGFIIALSELDNPQKVKGISYIRGAKPFAHFKQEIDRAMANLTE